MAVVYIQYSVDGFVSSIVHYVTKVTEEPAGTEVVNQEHDV